MSYYAAQLQYKHIEIVWVIPAERHGLLNFTFQIHHFLKSIRLKKWPKDVKENENASLINFESTKNEFHTWFLC